MENYNYICQFPWNSISVFVSLVTLFMVLFPKFYSFMIRVCFRNRLNRHFHDLQPKSNWGKKYEKVSDIEHIHIGNFKNNQLELINEKSVTFFKYQEIIFNENDDLLINSILVPQGYHFFKIISDLCIRIDFLNDKDELKSAFIFKENNVSHNDNKIFDKIIKWKYC